MPIRYPVAPRTLVLCDYSMGGFREPEIVKRRPAIVVSPRLPHRDGLCTVVPLSSTPGAYSVDYIVSLTLDPPLPAPFDFAECFAKCDMIATVSFDRLDLFRSGRGPDGKRKYLTRQISLEDFDRIRNGILHGLGFRHLT